MTEKLMWRVSEVIAFIEERIIDDIASEEEEIMYQDYKWSGKINKNTYEWKCVLRNMNKEYNGGF